MNADLVDKIVRAVLYEGYMLYPYRPSALKNRRRWSFGMLVPESSGSARTGVEQSCMQSECLVLGRPETMVGVSVRFLHLNGGEETLEREAAGRSDLATLAAGPVSFQLRFPSEESAGGSRWRRVEGAVETAAAPAGDGSYKISARVRNVTPFDESAESKRNDALTRSFLSTHIILHAEGGEFVSLMDPPAKYRRAAEGCRNIGAWPVLVGAEGERDCMLCSPIVLYDYPEIAPESPGDLFDGTEIDELLTLRVLTLTEEEKRAMREGDARAREILERSEGLPDEQLMKMHGAVRGLKAK